MTSRKRPPAAPAPLPAPAGEPAVARQHHRIDITPIEGDRYEVRYRGQLILISHDPERDACRVLVGMGHSGSLTSYRGSMPCLILGDIHRSAKRMASGSQVVPYKAEERQVTPMVIDRRGGNMRRKAG
jgi:hypothetical protein